MQEIVTELKEVSVVRSLTCDRCQRNVSMSSIDDIVERQEFLCLKGVGGFGSEIGDGTKWSVDLCQHCLTELLGPYLRKEAPSCCDEWPPRPPAVAAKATAAAPAVGQGSLQPPYDDGQDIEGYEPGSQPPMVSFEKLISGRDGIVLDDTELKKVLTALAPWMDRLAVAMCGYDCDIRARIYENLTPKSADRLRDELSAASPRLREIELAQLEIATLVSEMERDGAICTCTIEDDDR